MSEVLAWFEAGVRRHALTLPFDYRAIVDEWAGLRKSMVREVPDAFTRDEWAYLVTFLERDRVLAPFRDTFGEPAEAAPGLPYRLFRPRGPIAVWLPNNVSLLGPLTLVLLSLTGQRIRLKLGSGAQDLCGAFVDFARSRLPTGALRDYLEHEVSTESFGRDDPRHQELAQGAAVRVAFGSDESAAAIHSLPHPVDSVGFSFADRRSEAWLEPSAADDSVLTTLIKVFAVYGQAGCTSPARVVLIDGSPEQARDLRDRLVERWNRVMPDDPAMHTASSNVLALQWARALGWAPRLAGRNAALLASGDTGLAPFDAPMALRIVAASREEALASLPDNIQTVGHALADPGSADWLALLARSKVLRFVPLAQMHHFSHVWDGQEFWRQCFVAMEAQP